MKLCNLRVLFLLLCTLFFPQFIFAAEKPEDEIEEDFTIKDTLLYGIESEIQGFVKEQKAELSDEHMNILYERYLSSVLLQTKMELVRYFTQCEKLPENIKTYIAEEAINEDTNKELRLTEFAFLAKHGNQDSINYLIEQLSENDIITQQNAAVALSKAKDEPTAGLVLEYLKSTDSTITDDVTDDSEDFEDEEYSDNDSIELSDDIKTILLRAFGEWKYQPATDYLKQLLESDISGKFVKMYAMSAASDDNHHPSSFRHYQESHVKLYQQCESSHILYNSSKASLYCSTRSLLKSALKNSNRSPILCTYSFVRSDTKAPASINILEISNAFTI